MTAQTTPLIARAMELLAEEKEEAVAARMAAEEELNAAVDELRSVRLDLHTALLERGVAQEEAARLSPVLTGVELQQAVDDLAELSVTPAEVSALILRTLARRDAAAAGLARGLRGLAT